MFTVLLFVKAKGNGYIYYDKVALFMLKLCFYVLFKWMEPDYNLCQAGPLDDGVLLPSCYLDKFLLNKELIYLFKVIIIPEIILMWLYQ